ncbi:hypothetical protein [Mesorhizobium sp. M0678]|uniref:hypothetical protein n=1 Tax=Mesorhizobium sp. M0678 TaxID=2956985 RepID=UPI003334D414
MWLNQDVFYAAARKGGSEPSAWWLRTRSHQWREGSARRQARRGDIFQRRVEPLGEISGLLGPRAGKDLIGRVPQKHGATVGKLDVLEFCISSFQVTPGSFSTSAMPSTLMNSVTMSFLMGFSFVRGRIVLVFCDTLREIGAVLCCF